MNVLLNYYYEKKIEHLKRKLDKKATDLELRLAELSYYYDNGDTVNLIIGLPSLIDTNERCYELSKKLYSLSLHVDRIDSDKFKKSLLVITEKRMRLNEFYDSIMGKLVESVKENEAS